MLESNKSVRNLITAVLESWPGEYILNGQSSEPHEAERLHLSIDKACNELGWKPRWDFRQLKKPSTGIKLTNKEIIHLKLP